MIQTIRAEVPRAFKPLLALKRYKAAYGGRGAAKSHFFAEQLLLRALTKKTRAVCIREVQKSLKDSVRQLLVDKIEKLNLGSEFEVLESEISELDFNFREYASTYFGRVGLRLQDPALSAWLAQV